MLFLYNMSYNYFFVSIFRHTKHLYIKNNYCYIVNITRDIFYRKSKIKVIINDR